ncbi:uncharacterized protein G2W53_025062 [Senna tora]|uniref:Uncharacterized protein n=1 Tax=Senna tora TaxID=362788 RepID=A0A834WEE5_9FABA|nr:uncharacterized protein G2W53_025062 [Senna tora]
MENCINFPGIPPHRKTPKGKSKGMHMSDIHKEEIKRT